MAQAKCASSTANKRRPQTSAQEGAVPYRYRPNLSHLLQKAWMCAKLAARRFGGSPRAYLATTMRQAWEGEKALAQRCNAMAARFQAALAEIKALPRPPVTVWRRHDIGRHYGRTYGHHAV